MSIETTATDQHSESQATKFILSSTLKQLSDLVHIFMSVTIAFLFGISCEIFSVCLDVTYDSLCKLGELEVAGSQITVGARALAKHVPRSSKGWWGSFSGTGISVCFCIVRA
jgi:hypothetical protein